MRANAQAGYSLVELLIVLALLGLISLAIAGGMSFGTRVWERAEQEVSTTERATGGHALLRALLSNVYPRKSGEAGSEQHVAFEGTRDHMTFLVAASAQLGDTGIAQLALTIERDAGAATLTLSSHAETSGEGDRKERLLADAKDISFAYAESIDGALNWTDAWQLRGTLPVLIRVRASLPPGKGRWPDLIARPRIDRAAGCIFDPVSFECRRG
jgi:general secretion pathway protein J